jgi:hypothetical protein
MQLIKSDSFFEARYKDKVLLQVDSSVEEEETIERLLKVEHTDELTEIVIHVNMLKEGWDVTNLYTIVPLRAANARTLIEQSIGRGLRLPYGKRTGVTALDRLNIVAHDRFQEIVDEAKKPDWAIRLQQVILSNDQIQQKTVTVVSQPQLASKLGLQSESAGPSASLFAFKCRGIFGRTLRSYMTLLSRAGSRSFEVAPTPQRLTRNPWISEFRRLTKAICPSVGSPAASMRLRSFSLMPSRNSRSFPKENRSSGSSQPVASFSSFIAAAQRTWNTSRISSRRRSARFICWSQRQPIS